MPTLPFLQVDAFADRAFVGNQAAVVPLESWLDDATLQAIAAENNVAETAFHLPDATGAADYELRWFSPAVEVALCGHATLASGHAVLSGDPTRDAVTFRTRKSGILRVARADDAYELDLPALPPAPGSLPGLADALGADPAQSLLHGRDYALAVFSSAQQVRALRPDFRALAALPGGDVLVIATAPGEDTDVISRVFAPSAGIDEDPVTGAAHAVLTPYWSARLGRLRLTAYQASARGGYVGCEARGDFVRLSGRCVTVIEGTLRF